MPDLNDDALDALLGDWTTPPPGRDLHERIVASAPTTKQRSRLGVWWAAAAGIGLAGAMAGALLAAVIAPAAPAPGALAPSAGDGIYAAGATVFGDLDEAWES